MNMEVTETGLTKIMFLEPQCYKEEKLLADFCRIDTPLETTIKRGHSYRHPYIEIRKET